MGVYAEGVPEMLLLNCRQSNSTARIVAADRVHLKTYKPWITRDGIQCLAKLMARMSGRCDGATALPPTGSRHRLGLR